MNDPWQGFLGDEQHWMDRLVDGELNDEQRRELLVRLDSDPGGWRRCAMAFLEAQQWRHEVRLSMQKLELNSVAREPVPTMGNDFAAPSRKGRRWRVPSWRSALALAATFLIAFCLGLAASRSRPVEVSQLHNEPAERQSNARQATPVSTESHTTTAAAASDDLATTDVVSVKLLALSMERDGKELAYAVPVIEGPGIDAEWLQRQPGVVSASVRQTLESMGHQIVEHRELINIPLEGGRQVVVPVDQVKVRLANRVYQ